MEEIKQRLQNLEDIVNNFKYDNFNTPFHTHNGTDSPALDFIIPNKTLKTSNSADIIATFKGYKAGYCFQGFTQTGNYNYIVFILQNVILYWDSNSNTWTKYNKT